MQVFSLTSKETLQTDDLCLDVSIIGGPVKLIQCHSMGGNQRWQYDMEVVILNILLQNCSLPALWLISVYKIVVPHWQLK